MTARWQLDDMVVQMDLLFVQTNAKWRQDKRLWKQ